MFGVGDERLKGRKVKGCEDEEGCGVILRDRRK